MSTLTDRLGELGFTEDQASIDALRGNAEAQGMSANGAYTVVTALVKDDVTVVVEQNNARDDLGDGMSAIVEHPPVAVISSPKGRVAVNPEDVTLLLDLVAELT